MERSSNSRQLERKLRELKAERDAFERDVTVYLQENKHLKEQVEVLKSSHTASDTQAVQVLNDIRQHHKQLIELKEDEYVSELKRKDKATRFLDSKLKDVELKLKNAETKIFQHKSVVEKLEENINKLQTENEKLRQIEKNHKTTSSNNTSQLKTLEKKVATLSKQNDEKEQYLASIIEKYENETEVTASKTRVRIRVLEEQIKTMKAECDKKSNDLTKTSSKLAAVSSEREAVTSQQKQKLVDVEKRLKENLKESENIQEQLYQAKEKISCLEGEQHSMATKHRIKTKALEESLERMKKENNTKEEQLNLLNSKLSNAEKTTDNLTSKQKSQMRSLEDKIKSLQYQVEVKDDELSKTEEQLSSIQSECTTLTAKHRVKTKALEEKLEKLKKECDLKDEQLHMTSHKLSSAEKTTTALTSRQKGQMRSLEEKVNQLQHELDIKDDELSKINSENKILKSRSDNLVAKQRSETQALQDKLVKAQETLDEKLLELDKVSSKLAGLENNSQATTFKQTLHARALETKLKKLESEMKQKDEKIFELTTELSNHSLEVKSVSSHQLTQVKTLEDKIQKLEAENQKREEHLYKVSTKLAHTELEGDSVASNYRVKIRALEEKSERLQQENQLKEDQLIKAESGCSEAQSKLHKLKEKVRRLELEVSRKDDELNDLRSVETEFLSKTSASMSQIQTVQREKNRLEADNKRLKTELNEMTRRISSLECDVADAKCSIKHKERQIEKLSNAENQVKLVTSEKENNEEKMQHKIMSLRLTSDQLKSEVKNLKHELQSAKKEVTQLSKDLSNEKKQCQLLKENSSASSRKLQQSQNEQRQTVEQQARTIEDLQEKLETAESALFRTKQECKSLKHQCSSSENEIATLIPLQQQVEEYRKQCSQLQNTNSAQASKFEKLVKENREMKRNLEGLGSEQLTQSRKAIELEKTSDMLKESCVMLERQVEELETFNNELIEKQDALTRERDSALSQCSTLEVELKSLQRELRNEMCEMDQNNSDQITELKIQLREEINQTHESAEEYRDLERRYKMLELNATGVQRKLTAEKDCRDRAENELERIKSDLIVMQQSLSRSEHQLHIEIDRCDEAEKEKTQLLNRMETEKLEHSHELVRLNCTGAQQIKLIDFLQSRVEELESSDKKKKKQKKTTVYQAPLQYRELCDLLEEEKASNVRLQQQVNMLRSELQDSNTKVKRIKHGMDTPLSPGSIAAISSIVKSPAPSSTISPTSKGGKLRSKPRMHHNIPHRLSTWLCTRATRCSVCLAIIHFGHSSLRCSECSVTCHTKCKKSVTNTCGLPGGLFEQFKEGTKPSNLSPITCVFKGGNQDQMHGCLKVLCGDDSWASRTVRLTSTHLRILPLNAKSPSKGEKDDVIDLSKAAYVHTDVSQAELPGTARQDLPYVFKIHTGSSNSCWPARSVFFLAAGYAEKHQWVEKLEGVTSRHNGSRNISNNAKILGNEILTLLSDEKLEMNCSLPISDKHILFGCDEGLYLLAPSTSAVSTRANMTQVKGVGKVFQMILLSKHQVVAIEGSKHRLVTFDISTITEHKVALQDAEVENCHVIACGHAEGVHYLCAASASSVTILKYNERLKKFCKQKEVATSEPCTCMLFTACSVIIGTNTFYEIDLTDYKIDEFLNIGDRALSRRLKDSSIFPVAVLKIKDEEGRQEFLLCFHEFGLFVDGFGRLTREGQISWSRMPLSFEYREPYLVVVQFNSVEILQLDSTQDVSAEEAVIDHSFLSFPSGRFLGPAITSGAVYLSSVEGSRTSVFCCKGNMKGGSREAVKIANKRRYAALSASTDSLASPTVKRSSALSDMSNLRESRDISSSCQSIDTSRWTSGTSDCDAISVDTNTDSETLINTATDSDTVVPSSEEGSTSDAYSDDVSARLRWRPVQSSTTRKAAPAKPARRRDMASGSKYGQVPSTEV